MGICQYPIGQYLYYFIIFFSFYMIPTISITDWSIQTSLISKEYLETT